MSTLRLVLRAVALGLGTAVLVLVCALGWIPALLLGRTGAWRARMLQVWSRWLCWILGARVEVRGQPPRGSFLLVTNHLSYVDVVVLGSCLRCCFVSKAEVRHWPLIGVLSRIGGTIFIDRDRRRDVVQAGGAIQRVLEQGNAVVFFPEGTSTAGDEILPFRSSLLEPAAALARPVHHATLRYTTPPGQPPARWSVAWWGDMDFLPHFLGLLRLRGFRAEVAFGAEPVQPADRKSLAVRLHGAVASRFLPMLPEEDACLPSRTSPASS